VAAPTSPNPAALASGAMVCEVTEVLTGLNMFSFSCADSVIDTSVHAMKAKTFRRRFLQIIYVLI
jgi:hypothetical protein